MELSIVIAHYRSPEFLKICLDSLKQTVLDISYEIILVDINATRVTRDVAEEYGKKFDNFKYLPSKYNTGFAKAVNIGLSNATGKYYLILNADIVASVGAVSSMHDYMKSHPDIGLIGPAMRNFNETHQQTSLDSTHS